jgi:hypothetical protein
MPELIRHPVFFWIQAFAGMTSLRYLIAGLINSPLWQEDDAPVNVCLEDTLSK